MCAKLTPIILQDREETNPVHSQEFFYAVNCIFCCDVNLFAANVEHEHKIIAGVVVLLLLLLLL